VDGMVCSLFNWSYHGGTLTRRVRIGVGTKANFAPCAHNWDRNGCCAAIHSATGPGGRHRFFQNSKARLQLRQKSDHAHCLWTWSIPGGSGDSLANPRSASSYATPRSELLGSRRVKAHGIVVQIPARNFQRFVLRYFIRSHHFRQSGRQGVARRVDTQPVRLL
jgi:hypothetical protein